MTGGGAGTMISALRMSLLEEDYTYSVLSCGQIEGSICQVAYYKRSIR